MDHRKWSTDEEIEFIDRLGIFRNGAQFADRLTLLKGYVAGIRQRKEWGTIDKFEVLNHAIAALDRAREQRLGVGGVNN